MVACIAPRISLLLTKFIVYGNLFFSLHLFRQHTAAIVFLLNGFEEREKRGGPTNVFLKCAKPLLYGDARGGAIQLEQVCDRIMNIGRKE